MIWNEILCVGDSITYGARDSQGRSFPAELAKILTEKTGEFFFCHNHGICGETSSDVLRRIWPITKSNSGAKIATLMIGTNDTQVPITEEVYEDNLRQIIGTLRLHGMRVILCTLPKLGWTPLYLNNTDYIDKYNKIINKFGKTDGVVVCDVSGSESEYIDGVHYTHEGYKLLANIVAETILST